MKTPSIPAFFSLCAALFCSVLLGGCLTAGRKVITLRVNADGTGSGTMVFQDIGSMREEEQDNSLTDYSRLVDGWLHGDAFEQANPALYNVKKRLFAEGSKLNGEISFQFYHYSDIGLFRYNDAGPWMYYTQVNASEIERFDTSNGEFGGAMMPVVFWPEKAKEFRIENAFESGDRPVASLYPLYNRLGVQKKK